MDKKLKRFKEQLEERADKEKSKEFEDFTKKLELFIESQRQKQDLELELIGGKESVNICRKFDLTEWEIEVFKNALLVGITPFKLEHLINSYNGDNGIKSVVDLDEFIKTYIYIIKLKGVGFSYDIL